VKRLEKLYGILCEPVRVFVNFNGVAVPEMNETYYLTHLRELSQSINHPLRQTKRIKVCNLIPIFIMFTQNQ
jgi:hypothetical protein